MTSVDRLTDQHVKEYESRLKHVDELLARARSRASGKAGVERELAELSNSRDELAQHVEQLKDPRARSSEAASAGPMAVWDAVARQLERLIERLER